LKNNAYCLFSKQELLELLYRKDVSLDVVADRAGRIVRKDGSAIREITQHQAERYLPSAAKATLCVNTPSDVTVYHGSQTVITSPRLGGGNAENDYGQGFYTTQSFNLAGEWAVLDRKNKRISDGVINEYSLNFDGLDVLDLTKLSVSVWIALLMKYRGDRLDELDWYRVREYMATHYKEQDKGKDIISGWRADNRYFRFALDYATKRINRAELEYAIRYGNLGLQVFIKSAKAFSRLNFVRFCPATAKQYGKAATDRERVTDATYANIIRLREARKNV
jgi:hypothetical protein